LRWLSLLYVMSSRLFDTKMTRLLNDVCSHTTSGGPIQTIGVYSINAPRTANRKLKIYERSASAPTYVTY